MDVPGGKIINVTILQRSVARIERPTVQTGMTPEHRVRPLIPSDDPKATDPFLLLMEASYATGSLRPAGYSPTLVQVMSGAKTFTGGVRFDAGAPRSFS
jgi:hypothetical protein